MENQDIRNILIVDDQSVILKAISNFFMESKQPYKITKSNNGKDALKIIEKNLPDLIITDWEMPVMDGIEFIKRLKEDNDTADIPVIMCTGAKTSSGNMEMAFEAGVVDYIRKPIDKIELIARTKANLHLADNYKKIKKLNELKDSILSIISHDLRDPVGSIKSFMDLIIEKKSIYDSAKITQLLNVVRKQSASVYSILENLLAWANSQRKNIVFQPEYQEINMAVKDNIELLTAMAEMKLIVINNKIKDDIFTSFDSSLISTVIRNLISNAIKFTPEKGSIIINAEKLQSEIVVSVSDSGIGINRERISKIFDKTTFDTTSGTNKEKGSGLGLKLCVDFIERHNGKIWVESELKKGSSFKFTLPITR